MTDSTAPLDYIQLMLHGDYLRRTLQFRRAARHYGQAAEIAINHPTLREFEACLKLAEMKMRLRIRELNDAELFLQQCLYLAEKRQNNGELREGEHEEGLVRRNLAWLHAYRHDYTAAYSEIELSLQIFRISADPVERALSQIVAERIYFRDVTSQTPRRNANLLRMECADRVRRTYSQLQVLRRSTAPSRYYLDNYPFAIKLAIAAERWDLAEALAHQYVAYSFIWSNHAYRTSAERWLKLVHQLQHGHLQPADYVGHPRAELAA